MDTPDNTSKARSGRSSSSTTARATAANKSSAADSRNDPDLMAAIEAERARLMQAESLLQCILIAMEYDGNEVRKPYYPTLIELARNLVNKSIGQLDSVRMRPLIEDSKRSEAYGSAEQKDPAQHEHMVKDSAKVLYLS